MAFFKRFSRKRMAALLADQELHKSDGGSPRDERRSNDQRYLDQVRTLREALDDFTEAERREDKLAGALWTALGGTLARMWPAFAAEAIHAHEQALACKPDSPAYLYNFALAHKYAGRFAEGVELNRRAAKLRKGDEATLWNLGICATGAGDDAAALQAWRELGMSVQSGPDGVVFQGPGGHAQVRVTDEGPIAEPMTGDPEGAEYLWMERLGPAHARILSPTLRNFYADVGDIVLHDGAALGYRDDGKSKVPRFPVLALLRRGTLRTFRFAGAQPERGQLALLAKDLGEDSVYVHSEMTSLLCAKCVREGAIGHIHEKLIPDRRIVYGKLVAEESALAAFREKLDAALARRPELALYAPSLHRALDDDDRADDERRLWSSLETN
jgi:tetratricopeptide (TPR) repeat protein